MSSVISLAISPCPNDTFIFEHWLHAQQSDLRVEVSFHDIEQLNQGALRGKWDVVKVSCAVADQLSGHYELLSTGGAMGVGVGPLLVATSADKTLNADSKVAIPGFHTTAYKLFRFAFPSLGCQCIAYHFADIEDAVREGKVDAGVIIHEGRFTYQEKNLHCLADLGSVWEKQTQLPVPLGCIMMRKELYPRLGSSVEKAIKDSIHHSWESYPHLSSFVCEHAQTMQEEVMRSHIQLYVNDFSLDMGEQGRRAIQMLNSI